MLFLMAAQFETGNLQIRWQIFANFIAESKCTVYFVTPINWKLLRNYHGGVAAPSHANFATVS
jgi:hypothetical protein